MRGGIRRLQETSLSKRFASAEGLPELRFKLGQHCQQPTETLDEFADGLMDLTNRAYPDMGPALRMELARDRFVAGVREDYVQEQLLQDPPTTLDGARDRAKRLEAAQAAHVQIRKVRRQSVNTVEPQPGDVESPTEHSEQLQDPGAIAAAGFATGRADD